MPNVIRLIVLCLLMVVPAAGCFAAQIRVFVAPFAVTGVAERDELKTTLQNLLQSRLSTGDILAVDTAERADIEVKGSYVAFGKVFSIDAVARDKDGSTLVRAFEQGESREEVLTAVGKLAKTLQSGIGKNFVPKPVIPSPVPAAITATPAAAPSAVSSAPPVAAAAVTVTQVPAAPPSDIVRVEKQERMGGSGWISQKLIGERTGIALGRKQATGERDLFIAGNHSLQYYRLGKEMTLLTEITLPAYQKIIALDTADLDNDGVQEIYLTLIQNEDLASEVWVAENQSLKKIAGKLPYFFRSISMSGRNDRVYAQQMGRDVDFYGDLYEVSKSGQSFDFAKPTKLPVHTDIFTVNMFSAKDGKSFFVGLNPDGYLVVFDANRNEVWRSSDKYGGSENYFSREDLAEVKTTGNPQRKVFLEQRITVTKGGEIIVPRNEGFFNVGNSRSFTKNAVYAFVWNGVMLEESWHTKQDQSYLADYLYDEDNKELLLLEVVKKEGLFDKGASAVAIKRVE